MKKKAKEITLKPCPHCGGAVRMQQGLSGLATWGTPHVFCDTCGAVTMLAHDDKDGAADAWNRRCGEEGETTDAEEIKQYLYGVCAICVHRCESMTDAASPCYEYGLSGLMTGIYTRCEHWEFAVTGDEFEKEVDTP